MLKWCPETSERTGGVVGGTMKAYNKDRRWPWASVLWGGVCLALAGALVLSAVDSARQARVLSEQMERLEEQIHKVKEKNESLKSSAIERPARGHSELPGAPDHG